MYYSKLIQSSPTSTTFEWNSPNKYRNPTITSITVLFTPNQGMFNNVYSTNVVTNTNDEERTVSPFYYTIGEIIAILNIMTDDTTFSISAKASGYMCIWIQSPHTIDFTNARVIREILGLEGVSSFYLIPSMDRM